MQNFSFLAGLEVTEKFVRGGLGGFQVSNVSNPIDHDSFVLKVLTAHTLPMHLYLTGSQLTCQGLEP